MTKNDEFALAMSIGVLLAAARSPAAAKAAEQAKRRNRPRRTRAAERRDLHRGWRAQLGGSGRDQGRAHRVRRQRRGREGLHRRRHEVVDLKGRMVVPGIPGCAHPPDLGGHRGERLQPERLETVDEYVADHQEIRGRASGRALDHRRRLVDGGIRAGRARAQGTDRCGRAGPAGDPLQPGRPHVLGQQQGARSRRHHERDAGPAGRAHRPRPEDRASGRQPAGRREQPGRRQDAAEHRREARRRDCVTR